MLKDAHGDPLFYGWYIVAAGFLVMAVSIGIVNNCAGLFIKPICADMGFSRQAIGGNQTIISAAQMAMALCSGKIFSRFPVKRVMQLCTITLAASYFSYSMANSLAAFYAISLVVGLSMGGINTVPISLLISNWFYEKRGLAVGVAFMGSGVGGMMFNSLAGVCIEHLGWRPTYQILTGLIVLFIAPAVFWIIRTTPQEMGLHPLGEKFVTGGSVPEDREGMTLAEAKKGVRLWCLCLCAMANSVCLGLLMQNIAPHISDVGYSTTFAANMTAVCMGALAIGKLSLGQLYDKLGARVATTIAGLAALVGLVGCYFAQFPPALALIAAGAGLGCAFGSVAHPIITQIVYGRKDYSAILGVIQASSNAGGIFTFMLSGWAYDTFHSYRPAYLAAIVTISLTTLCYQVIFPRDGKRSRA